MNEFDQYSKQFSSHNKKARANAAYQLGLLGDPRAIDLLEKGLNDSSLNVRCKIIHALSHFEDHKVFAILKTTLNDPNDSIYYCATSALARIGDDEAISILINEVYSQEGTRRHNATNKLIKVGLPAVPSLINAFYNSTGRTRAYFLKALGKIGDVRAKGVFKHALTDDCYDVYWVAIAIQRTICDPEAVPILMDVLDHQEYLRQATAAKTLETV